MTVGLTLTSTVALTPRPSQLTHHRHASQEPLLLLETRALAVNVVVRSLSMDLTLSLADMSIQDLHTRFDNARCNLVAKSGRIHEAADAGEAGSAPGCLVLELSLVDRKAPGYTTDVAYRAKLGGFGLVCSAPLVHLCSKWATDAFRLHSTASGDQHVPSQVPTENGEGHFFGDAGDRDRMHRSRRSMSTDVSVEQLDVSFITVEGGQYAHLGILRILHLGSVSWSSACAKCCCESTLACLNDEMAVEALALTYTLTLAQLCWKRLDSRLSTDNLGAKVS